MCVRNVYARVCVRSLKNSRELKTIYNQKSRRQIKSLDVITAWVDRLKSLPLEVFVCVKEGGTGKSSLQEVVSCSEDVTNGGSCT